VTNSHVVEDTSSITMTLEDGRTLSVVSALTGSVANLAVLKIDTQDLPTVQIGDSSNKLQVGDWVAAIGNSSVWGQALPRGLLTPSGFLYPCRPERLCLTLSRQMQPLIPVTMEGLW